MWLFSVLLLLDTLCTKGDAVLTSDKDLAGLDVLLDQIDSDRIGEFIKGMSKFPRNTQSQWMGEKEQDVKEMFRNFGFDVITKKYTVLQSFPKEVDPSLTEVLDEQGVVVETYREDGNKEQLILPAFNAFSKSGTVEGEPVYVNYGRKKDFEKLKTELGLDLEGKIGIARYGKLFRGDKAKFAKEYGLAGLIMYMDGADYNPEDNAMPDGPGLPDTGIQRGTLKSEIGDPSTYLYPSTKYAYHDTPEDYEHRLPGITVMPINFKNALPLLEALKGDEVLQTDDVTTNWQGKGSEQFTRYHYGPGFQPGSGKKRLRITVNLEYKLVEIEDIFGVVRGQKEPDRWVMIGNHRDTWVHGAVDATTGLATLNELGHGFKALMEGGWKPRRTVVFASWGAEEQGLIGSTEFVEDYMTLLQEKMVAYINVDVAASGNANFKPAATPNFRPLLERAAKRASASQSSYDSLFDQWKDLSTEDEAEPPVLKSLGSGSDYAAFLNLAGVSCIDLSIVGNYHTYHTEYDNYHYLSTFADPGMKATKAVAEVAAAVLFELAVSRTVPLNAVSYSTYVSEKVKGSSLSEDLEAEGINYDMFWDALDKFSKESVKYEKLRETLQQRNRLHLELRRFNDRMLQMERSFIYPPGLPNRPQNRHQVFAPSVLDSYSGSVYPGLFDAVEMAKMSGNESDWNLVKKQVTIATWVTKAASRALSGSTFPR